MSLLKQLLASVTIIMGLILAGSTMVSVDAVRQYLNGQLQAQSDNTASALAMLLSQPANQDGAIRETLMMALFDSGQFRAISLKDTKDAVLFERTLAPLSEPAAVPAWFRRILPLEPASAIREVTDGWRQVGVVSVTADDASADGVLWRSSLRLLVLVLAVGAAWALLVALLVKWFKKALAREIRSQLKELADNDGASKASGPFPVPGLTDVSRAIQEARTQVQAKRQALAERIDSLETEVSHDPVTGLPNHKYFIGWMLRQDQERKDTARAGEQYILLVRQRDLGRINSVMTRAEADQWLRMVGESIKDAVQGGIHAEAPLLARLNGSDFAVLIHAADHSEVLTKAQGVRCELDTLRIKVEDGSLCRWAYALARYQPQADISAVLSCLDIGLMKAESSDQDTIEFVD